MKKCTLCHEIKPVNEFHRWAQAKSGYKCKCKICQEIKRKDWLRRNPDWQLSRRLGKYNLSLEDYETLIQEQENCCAICGLAAENNPYKTLCIDHDHEINKVRGLLCNRCNRTLGLIGDDIDILSSAISYLRNNR